MAKTAFITGSSRGLGLGAALEFARAGYNIIINSSKSADELLSAQKLIEAEGVRCERFLGDLGNPDTCEKIFAEAGLIDVLINNAGISHIGLLTDMSAEEINSVIVTNLISAINCSRLAAKAMLRQGRGNIINISSVWGGRGAACEAVYSASKGALETFTRALAKELGPSGIRVNAISCGVMDTRMNECFSEEERYALLENIPLGRFGTPEELGKLALFLDSDAAGYITGQVIGLNGGM